MSRRQTPATSLPHRFARGLFLLLAAVVIVFEELAWDQLSRLAARLAALPVVARLEARIVRLPARWAVALFCAPYLTLLPLKIMAVYLVAQGQGGRALLLILIAKVAGTALVARLYVLTQATLMTVPWFARLFERYQRLKRHLKAALVASVAWRLVLGARRLRESWGGGFARRWRSGRKRVRRWLFARAR